MSPQSRKPPDTDFRTEVRIDEIAAITAELKSLATKSDVKEQIDGLIALLGEANTRYQQRFEAQERLMEETDKRYQQRSDAQEKAVALAFETYKERFASVNEFRGQIGDQQRNFPTRLEVDARVNGLAEKLDTVVGAITKELAAASKRLDIAEGKAGGISQFWGAGLGVVALIIAAVGLFLKFN